MQKHLKPFSFIMVCLLLIVSCQEPDGIDKLQDEATMSLRTVDAKEVSIDFKKKNQNKSASWITPYFQFTDSIPLINSNAQITVTPVITTIPDAYSRLFSIEIDGNLETVVYHMFANDQSTDVAFWGRAIITDLNGEILSAWDVEDNIFTGYYDVANHPETLSILNYNKNTTTKNTGGGDDTSNPDDGDVNGGDLDDVTIIAPGSGGLSAGIKIIYYPEFTIGDEEGIGGTSGGNTPTEPEEPAAVANSMNEDSCDPGQVLVDFECQDIVECPEGFILTPDNVCVTDPCEEIINLLNNTVYTDKVEELNTIYKVNNTHERGYGIDKDGNPYSLPLSNDGHSLKLTGLNLDNIVGFVHTHPCGKHDIGQGNSHTYIESIPMPSPSDINEFKKLLLRAKNAGRNLQDIYMTVISCHGIFDLKYRGTGDNISNWERKPGDELFKQYFNEYKNPIVAMKKYLDEVVNMAGNDFELYEYTLNETTDEYEVERQTVDGNGKDNFGIDDCN